MISKTKFKNYARCPRFSALESMKQDKEEAIVTGKSDEVKDLLSLMFGDGEDLIDVSDEQLEAMMPYFNKLEEISSNIVSNYFDGEITYSLKTHAQKSFDCWGENYQYICYIDIYLEKKNSFHIFETKATTTNKFTSLKYSENKETKHLFEKINNTYILKEELTPDFEKSDKYLNQRKKLFDKYSDSGKYVYDLAVQRWIIENHHIQNNKTKLIKDARYYLVVLNSDYVLDNDISNSNYPKINSQEIVSFIDLTEITKEYQSLIDIEYKMVESYLDYLKVEPHKLGKHCQRKKTTECEYSKICWDIVPAKDSLLTYIDNHHGFKDPTDTKHLPLDLINSGKVKIDDIPTTWLHREKNQIQREVFETKKIYINKKKIIDGLSQIKFPVYHLDFESFPCPLPRFRGEKPYSQSVFQYSLHIQKSYNDCDKEKNHYEFLSDKEIDQRRELVESLISNLNDEGTIIVWNQSFEIARLKEFAEIYPELKNKLYKIIDRVFDLMYILKSNTKLYLSLGYDEKIAKMFNYYHNSLQGSFSIKKVLPIFSNLSYAGMDVGNGMEAVTAYIMLHKLKGDDFRKKYQALLEYCKQDTWAMVEIMNELKILVK
ncbi:DUF2779 domain-containing protein [Mycoplasmatota bacterium zrk1]